MAKEKNTKQANAYVSLIQQQVNADIQAIKGGALTEDLLRARLTNNPGADSPQVRLTLWLCGLLSGLVDDLEVVVSDGEDGPEFTFLPQWKQITNPMTPILRLPIPGPAKPTQLASPAPQIDEEDPPAAAEA